MPPFVDISVAVSLIISLSSCNLIFGLIVYLVEKEGDNMKTRVNNLTVLSLLLTIIVASGIYNSHAAEVANRFDHRSGANLELISSLDVTSDERTQLRCALSSCGPSVNTAWQRPM